MVMNSSHGIRKIRKNHLKQTHPSIWKTSQPVNVHQMETHKTSHSCLKQWYLLDFPGFYQKLKNTWQSLHIGFYGILYKTSTFRYLRHLFFGLFW